jgi:hypothetical protein
MGETVSVKNGSMKQAKRLEALQARFDALEAGARERLLRALGAGQHKLGELDGALERMAHEDWTVDGMRKRLDAIRARAESFRTTALKRVSEVPATAMTAFANGSRTQVQHLSRELDRLVKLIEPAPVVKDVKTVEVKAPEVVVAEKPARAPKAKVEV